MARILLVEGDESVTVPLVRALARVGHTTTTVGTGGEGLVYAADGSFDLVLVAATLPDTNGHDVCDALHAARRGPVVILSDSRAQADLDAWSNGAEDYVVKPIRIAEALSLVRAVLNRWPLGTGRGEVLAVGPLELDTTARCVLVDGRSLKLTPKLVAVLMLLMRNAGMVVSRNALLDDVWGDHRVGRTLDVHVSLLRARLRDDPVHPRFIHTVRGVGFRFSSSEELGAGAVHAGR